MKFIIEGCDGVGKTTFAKKIAKLFNLEYQHDSAPRTYEEYFRELNNGIPRVYDRFFFGQFAGYQSEDERLINKVELIDLLNLAKRNNVVIILCVDKVSNIVKRFKHNDSDVEWMNKMKVNSVVEFVGKIQRGFINIASEVGKSYVHFLDMSKIVDFKEEAVPEDESKE